MKAVIRAIRQSPTYKLLGSIRPRRQRSYWRHASELWARAYAQYIAWRSGSSRLKSQVDMVLSHQDHGVRITQWPYDEFAPIAQAIDALMEKQGWAQKKPAKP